MAMLLVGCGASRPPPHRATAPARAVPVARHVALALSVGDVYEAVQREEILLSGQSVLARVTRLEVYVVGARDGGRYDLQVRMLRDGLDGARAATDVRLTVGPDGAPLTTPRSACFDDDVEHDLVRIVRHVLANRPGSSTYLGYESELRDVRVDVETRRAPRGVRLVRGTTRLDFFDVAGLRAAGPVELRARVAAEEASLVLTMHAESRGDVEVTDRTTGTVTTRLLVATSDVSIVALDSGSAPVECTIEPFDPQIVVRAINRRRSAIQACYERTLRAAPTLAGRVTVQMTIRPSGDTDDVHVVSPAAGLEVVGACVVRVVDGLFFDPGPMDGAVTFTFPFVFEPQS